MLTNEGKRRLLSAFLDLVVEAGWGTDGAPPSPNDTGLTNPTYTTTLAKRLDGDKAILEYVLAWYGSGTRTLREVGLFGRDANGNRVLLFRRVRDPIEMTPPLVVRDRLGLRLEDL